MTLVLASIVTLLASGVISYSLPGRHALRTGAAGAVLAATVGLAGATTAFLSSNPVDAVFHWGAFGSLTLRLDALSGFFLLPIFALSALAAIYGIEYLGVPHRKPLGTAAFQFNLLVASMVLVTLAADVLTFLFAWELMALSSFFLVSFDSDDVRVRDAGWMYLFASQLGTAFVFGFFLLLAGHAGATDFETMREAAATWPEAGGLLFVLAVIGFGTKAGFLPLHVWLPEAHPAAPSHVSALMSGVMIKTGIYGLVRAITLLGAPSSWWGWVLIGVGVTSGVLGVLFALAQHDLKRLLAYHSVENIGIIALGLGLGLIGIANDMPKLAVLGFAGGLLHVLNHALFKGLLFLGAGAVLHATHTRDIDHLGGLAKRMPWTSASFLIGAVAISGLPPLNGFVSELLIYLGAFGACVSRSYAVVFPALAALVGLALIGGLAAACFTKAFGAVFLGEPRSEHGRAATDPGPCMRFPMATLAGACVLGGLSAPLLLPAFEPLIAVATGISPAQARLELDAAAGVFVSVLIATIVFALLLGAFALIRARLLASRPVERSVTWDCGYARPTPSMQYTASSFADPLVRLFASFLGTRRNLSLPQGYFPAAGTLSTETPDVFTMRVFAPALRASLRLLARFRALQHGGVNLYVLYVALTLVTLLIAAFT